jgi:protein-tyrosine phosphatase
MEPPHASLIMDRLWIGDYHSSQDETFLRSQHIDVVFNCTKDLPFKNIAPTQYRIPLDDNLEDQEIYNAGLWAGEIAYLMTKEYREGKRILVHCMAGRQRSAMSVAVFLILYKGFTTDEAIGAIRSKRSIAFLPSANFKRSIQVFEKQYQEEILPRLTNSPRL